ncbi:MAG: type IV pilus modification protein PilV [Methylococcaceae bacterium]
MLKYRSFYSRGFTLIEVLIAMVILAIGLLGFAAMQAMSLRDNQDAYYYQQATLLASEMQDRIRGNSGITWTSITPNYSATACTQAAPCSSTAMATNDYGYWQTSVTNILPAPTGVGAKAVDIQLSSSVMKYACQGTYPTSLCLITTWGRTNSKSFGVLSNDSTYYLEITP